MFGLENRGKTLIFMSRHFDETMTILISHFLRLGALKLNKIRPKKKKKKSWFHLFLYPCSSESNTELIANNTLFAVESGRDKNK